MIEFYVIVGLAGFLFSVYRFHDSMETPDYFVVLALCVLIWPLIMVHALYLFITHKGGN